MQVPTGAKAYCLHPFEELLILNSGDVRFCCRHACSLGSVLERPLEEIWESDLAEEIRRDTFDPALHPSCRVGCTATDWVAKGNPPFYEPGEHRGPSRVSIMLHESHCNIGGENPTPDTACRMCYRGASDFVAQANHTDRIVEAVRPLLPNLSRLCIVGVAEPFWKDLLFQILDGLEFSRFADRILVGSNSNGTTLNARVRGKWFSSCPSSYLICGIDAASPETFRKIRRLDAYETIIENLRGFSREHDPERQHFFMAYNINLVNIREVEKMVEVASEVRPTGVKMTLTAEWGTTGMLPYLVREDTAILFARAIEKAVRRAEELGVKLTFERNAGGNTHVERMLAGDYPQLVELKAS